MAALTERVEVLEAEVAGLRALLARVVCATHTAALACAGCAADQAAAANADRTAAAKRLRSSLSPALATAPADVAREAVEGAHDAELAGWLSDARTRDVVLGILPLGRAAAIAFDAVVTPVPRTRVRVTPGFFDGLNVAPGWRDLKVRVLRDDAYQELLARDKHLAPALVAGLATAVPVDVAESRKLALSTWIALPEARRPTLAAVLAAGCEL